MSRPKKKTDEIVRREAFVPDGAEAEAEAPPPLPMSTSDFMKSNLAEGCVVTEFPAGVERVISVSATNIKEMKYRGWDGDKRVCPPQIIREKIPGADPNAFKTINAYRHVEVLGPSSIEYLPPESRIMKTNGHKGGVVIRTRGPLRAYLHPTDTPQHMHIGGRSIE